MIESRYHGFEDIHRLNGLGQVSVVVDSVSVDYSIETDTVLSRDEPLTGLKRYRRALSRRKRGKVSALSNIAFQAHEGEHVGIVGANGSGKSTLLRVIAGAQSPTSGRVLATSTPMLLGVSAAMQPNLSGRANIKLGLLALGFSLSEVPDISVDVEELAQIGEAIDRPMRTYSSGMGARLRFAIAAASKPSILLIDEALGTGDAAFVQRSERTIEKLRIAASTIFLVSHAPKTIEDMCTRAIWLHEGWMVADGSAQEVVRHYRKWARSIANEDFRMADKRLYGVRDTFLREGNL